MLGLPIMACALRAYGVGPGDRVLTNAFTLAPVPGAASTGTPLAHLASEPCAAGQISPTSVSLA